MLCSAACSLTASSSSSTTASPRVWRRRWQRTWPSEPEQRAQSTPPGFQLAVTAILQNKQAGEGTGGSSCRFRLREAVNTSSGKYLPQPLAASAGDCLLRGRLQFKSCLSNLKSGKKNVADSGVQLKRPAERKKKEPLDDIRDGF